MNKMVISNDTPVKSDQVGVKIATKTLTTQENFVCTPQDLYRVFTEKEVYFVISSL